MEDTLPQLYLALEGLIARSGVSVSQDTVQVIVILVSVFVLILTLGLARHHMLTWSIKGAWFGVLVGVILTLVAEGFLLVSSKTALVELVNNKNIPENIRNQVQENVLELAKNLSPLNSPKVLNAKAPDSETVIKEFKSLAPSGQSEVKGEICAP